jgi:prepilin peptidase CpaA
MAVPAPFIYLGTALAFAAIAAFTDVRERRIPNRLTGPGVLTGLLLHLALGGLNQLGLSLLAGLIAGTIFLLFYLAGGMGAGDVKLITAIGCIAGLAFLRDILLATVILGAIFALVLALVRGRLRQTLANVFILMVHHQAAGLTPHSELNVTSRASLRLPYAVPIAAGCLVALCLEISRGVRP